ncbi:hypothetical protein LshimejAT787_2300620 [Lyophyllum shimeji]|uniref:DUF6534 domain-containing protein n=1 Tax=Lyophyllum shimeji TaxID=47721 RepID=A0A9P3PYN6_LYOSH|nr:hypothetical protein LshimejAT787_2300620 [Lyophyllum shimeji]
MASVLPPIPHSVITTTAPKILGSLFNWALYGVLSVQVYIYYLNFPEDKLSTKCLDATCLTAADVFYWFASGYGNMVHLGNVYISPLDTPFLCGIIAAVVQCFFAYRIWTLQRSYWWICVGIVATSAVQTAGAFGTAFRAHELGQFARFHESVIFPASFHVWLLGDTVSDILIAGSMLWIYCKSRRHRHGHGNKLLARLVFLIVETNTLTASMALLSFILYARYPGKDLFICTTFVMGKLYSNTLLVTFNNRIVLRKVAVLENNIKGCNAGSFRRSLRGTTPTFDMIEIEVLKEMMSDIGDFLPHPAPGPRKFS